MAIWKTEFYNSGSPTIDIPEYKHDDSYKRGSRLARLVDRDLKRERRIKDFVEKGLSKEEMRAKLYGIVPGVYPEESKNGRTRKKDDKA